MSLWQNLKDEWLDENGQVLPEKNTPGGPQTGNGILYSSIAAIQLKRNGEWSLVTANWFDRMIWTCYPKGMRGLLNRAPEKDDQNGHDDYVGLSIAAKILDLPYASEIVARGRMICAKI